jgi:hypothetical protein
MTKFIISNLHMDDDLFGILSKFEYRYDYDMHISGYDFKQCELIVYDPELTTIAKLIFSEYITGIIDYDRT